MEEKDLESNLNCQEVAKTPDDLPETAFEKVNFQRSEEEAKIWEEIKNFIKNDFVSISDSDGNKLSLSRRIEEGFKFNAEERDDDFSSFHVEILLDQAADLLDRTFNRRRDFNDLFEKFYLLRLELGEYSELDAIHQEEEAAGFYDVERQQSDAELKSEQRRFTLFRELYRISSSNDIRDKYFTEGVINNLKKAVAKGAWLVGIVHYLFKGQEFGEYLTYDYWGKDAGGHNKSASLLSVESAEEQIQYSANLQKDLFLEGRTKENTNSSYGMEISGFRSNGLGAKSNWDFNDANFRRRRTLVARKYQDWKAALSTEDGGALNYDEKSNIYRDLFQQDFRDALARLKVVQQGLKDIYGYDVPLPPDENNRDYFEQCLLWSRKTISWLIRFSRAEQSLVLPISLRNVLGITAWNNGLSDGAWEVDMQEELFADFRHVRLRGLSAFVLGAEAKDKLWQMKIKVPATGQVKHLSGNTVALDQSKIPQCWLARVTDRNAQRDPDVFGMSILFNTSPIGKWTIQVVKSVPSSDDFSKITNIHLDLYLAFRV